MNPRNENDGTSGFLLGLITGGVVGAALAIAFAPRLAKELRERVSAAACDLGDSATKRYRDASERLSTAVDSAAARGQVVRDDAADAVARGAHQVEQFAMAAKSDARRS